MLIVPAACPASSTQAESGLQSPAACGRLEAGSGEATGPSGRAPQSPTLVGAGFYVTEIRDIDAVRDDFEFRGYVRASWCDPRLASTAGPDRRAERLFLGAQAERELGRIWFPAGYPINQVDQPRITERVLRIHPDGTVDHDLNLSVRLNADYDLRRFPFDRQVLELQIESFTWDRDALRFIPDQSISGFAEDLEIPEWRIIDVRTRVEEVPVIRSTVPFSRFILEVEVARKSGFYLWKVILPLLVIVGLSWSVFWMSDERLAGRSRISATGVLTIVAYQFVIAEDLPRVAYLTLLDKVMIASFGLLAVTVLESMLVARYQDSSPATAARIDRAARWVFPLVYALLLAVFAASAGS